MRRIAVPVLTLSIVGLYHTAAADPIRITSGGLDGNRQIANVTVSSPDRGFSMTGVGSTAGGIWAPSQDCFPGCLPGSINSLEAYWLGSDFPGNATIDGNSYVIGGGNEASGSVRFTGSWVAPPHVSDTATVTAPFVFRGGFVFPSVEGVESEMVPSFGRGLATLNLAWNRFDYGWELQTAQYRFSSDPGAATPEPATLLLLSTGVIGAAATRRRRVRSSAGLQACGRATAF